MKTYYPDSFAMHKHIKELEALNKELLAACKALQMEARDRKCGLRIADEAIAKAESVIENARTLTGTVSVAIEKMAEEIAKDILSDEEFRESLRALTRASAKRIMADLATDQKPV